MMRRTFAHRLSLLEDNVRELPTDPLVSLIKMATEEESLHALNLLSKLKNIKNSLWAKYAPEETRELVDLYMTLAKRREEQLGRELGLGLDS